MAVNAIGNVSLGKPRAGSPWQLVLLRMRVKVVGTGLIISGS